MSLIPFILDLAEELHDFNRSLANASMDIDDFGFGMYPLEQLATQQSQPPQSTPPHPQLSPSATRRAARLGAPSSVFWVPIKGQQQSQQQQQQHRHHPYNRVAGAKTVCCNKSLLELEKELLSDKVSGIGNAASGCAAQSVASKSAYSVVNRNGFQVSMNVKQFAPHELTVKTIDNCIVVEGQHDEKEDGHGVISRHFIRKYMLPKGFDAAEVHSTLSSDGILTVKAPPPPPPVVRAGEERLERIVDIQQSGGPAQLQQQPKDAQTPKAAAAPAATNSDDNEQQPPPPIAADVPEPMSKPNSDEERNGSAADAEAATAKETEPIVEASNKANNGVGVETAAAAAAPATELQSESKSEPMQVAAAAAEPADKQIEDSTKTEDSSKATATLADVNKDVEMVDTAATTTATVVAAAEIEEKAVTVTVAASKGAEELAAVDAAILLAKNQAGENGDAAAAKNEELVK